MISPKPHRALRFTILNGVDPVPIGRGSAQGISIPFELQQFVALVTGLALGYVAAVLFHARTLPSLVKLELKSRGRAPCKTSGRSRKYAVDVGQRGSGSLDQAYQIDHCQHYRVLLPTLETPRTSTLLVIAWSIRQCERSGRPPITKNAYGRTGRSTAACFHTGAPGDRQGVGGASPLR
jgi:hypothetical protein